MRRGSDVNPIMPSVCEFDKSVFELDKEGCDRLCSVITSGVLLLHQ